MDQQYCLRWNNHPSNLTGVLTSLLQREALCDVTLACDGEIVKVSYLNSAQSLEKFANPISSSLFLSLLQAHQTILSACSPYFEMIFLQNSHPHPIIYLKDVRYSEMRSLLDFMYKGEVNVGRSSLPTFLKTAESLQVSLTTIVIPMDSLSVTRKYSNLFQVRGLTDKNNLFYHPGEDDKDCDSESPSRLSGFDAVDKDRERSHRDDVTAALLHPGSGVGGGGRTRTNSDLHGSFPELIKHRDVLMERDASVTPVDSNLLLPNISNNNNNSNLINNNTTNTNNNKRRRKNSLNCDNTTSSITTAHGAQERHYSQDSQVRTNW